MAPEHNARTRSFYDHESDDPSPGRRRRAAADWGVGEDIFDRMPSRRFKRADRRAEHRDEPEAGRFERRVSGPSQPRAADEWDEAPRYDDWSDAHERRQVAPRRDDWADDARGATGWDEEAPRREAAPARETSEWDEPRRQAAPARETSEWDEPRRQAAPPRERRPARRPAESWTEGVEGSVAVEGKRPIESWLAPERGESRTIVLEVGEPSADGPQAHIDIVEEAPARRTVVIKGQPDRLPAPRTQRPPRTAVERIGARPDRIVGYAVLLGFMLILIAILTTGQ